MCSPYQHVPTEIEKCTHKINELWPFIKARSLNGLLSIQTWISPRYFLWTPLRILLHFFLSCLRELQIARNRYNFSGSFLGTASQAFAASIFVEFSGLILFLNNALILYKPVPLYYFNGNSLVRTMIYEGCSLYFGMFNGRHRLIIHAAF